MAATVTLEAGKRSVETTLEVVDDEPFEVPETLTLEAAAAGYNSSSVVTIVIYDDNYTPLTLTADPSSVAEPWGRSTVTVSVPEGKEPATDTVVSIFAFPSSTATKEIHYPIFNTGTGDWGILPPFWPKITCKLLILGRRS